MAGNLPPQFPPQLVMMYSFGETDSDMADPTLYRQQVTMSDSGVNIPNSVVTVSGQMTFTDACMITDRNNQFTIRCMPLVADTPTLNIQQINVESGTATIPPPAVPSGVWQSDIPPQSVNQLDLQWCPVGTWHYLGSPLGAIFEEAAILETDNVLNRAFAMPDTGTLIFNGVSTGSVKEYISNPFGQTCRIKNFNSVNTVSCIPNCNTAVYNFRPVGTGAVPNFIDPALAYVPISGEIHEFVSAVQMGQAPYDNRRIILRNPNACVNAVANPVSQYINFNYGGCSFPTPGLNSILWTSYTDIYTVSGAGNQQGGDFFGPSCQAASIGGYASTPYFVEIFTDGIEKVYGQSFFNTFCYSLNGQTVLDEGTNGFITGWGLPFPGIHPFDSVSHNGNFTYDHAISFVTGMTFLVDKVLCSKDNAAAGYHVFPINNSEDSAFHSHFTSPGSNYNIRIGHVWLPFLNRSGQNLFHPGWPIPCHQIVNNAPQPSAAGAGLRSQSDFATILNFNVDPAWGDNYNWCYTSANRTELATGANIKYGTCDYPKNNSTNEGYFQTFYNFPQTPFPICGVEPGSSFISCDQGGVVGPLVELGVGTNISGGWVPNPFNQSCAYSNNWLCPFPEGVCSEGAFVYTGRMAVIMQETKNAQGEHTGNYTTPLIWSHTFTLPPGNYTANSLLYEINKQISAPISSSLDFPLFRYVDFRDGDILAVATDYEDDTLTPWSSSTHACGRPDNRSGPDSLNHAGRIVSVKKGPNTKIQLGARNFGFLINADGKLSFTGTFTVDSPDALATSTLASGVPSVYYLPTPYARSGIDPPLYGDLGQLDLAAPTPTQLVIDEECWSLAPSVRMINTLEASVYYTANNLTLGFFGASGIVAETNTSNQVTSVQYLPATTFQEAYGLSETLFVQQSTPAFPNLQNFAGKLWSTLVVLDLATAARYSIQNGIYFNPCGSAFLPGSTGIQILSLCDGSDLERAFWETVGFNPDTLVNFFTPKYETVLPIEGLYYNTNTAEYEYSKEAFCVSNESPWLWKNLSNYYFESAPGYPYNGTNAQKLAWLNGVGPTPGFLSTLPNYGFQLPFFASDGALLTLTNPVETATGVDCLGWGAGLQTSFQTYRTNCPLFCTLNVGMPDEFLHGNAYIVPIDQNDFLLTAYLDEDTQVKVSMAGIQKYSIINDGVISGTSASGQWQAVNDTVGGTAAISVLDLFGMNPYNMHQSIPRPLNDGLFGTKYASSVYQVSPRQTAGQYSASWPIADMAELGQYLWTPMYTGFTGEGLLNGQTVSTCDYECISGSLACWPVPLSNYNLLTYANEFTTGMPLMSICSKNPAILLSRTDVGGFCFNHRSFLRMVDQMSTYCPDYDYDVSHPDVYPVLSHLEFYFQSVTDACAPMAGPLYQGGAGPPPLLPAVKGNWLDILGANIQYHVGNNDVGFTMQQIGTLISESTPLNQYCSIYDRGWQVPIAGRVRCDQVATYYLNSTPLQYERGASGLVSLPEILERPETYGEAFKNIPERATHYLTDKNGPVYVGAESRKVSFCTNLSITNSTALGYIFNSQSSAIAGYNYSNPINQNSRGSVGPVQISTKGSGNYDPSDPVQITSLFTQSHTAFGQFSLGNLNDDGMFVIAISGSPNLSFGLQTWINGCRARNYIPVAVQSSAGLTNTISFNTSIPFDVAAQIINTMTFEFFDVALQALTNIINIRLLLTFTPTGQPTPEEQAYINSLSPSQIQSQVPSQVNYAGPNSLLAQPPSELNVAGFKRPSDAVPAYQTRTRPGMYPTFIPSAKSTMNLF